MARRCELLDRRFRALQVELRVRSARVCLCAPAIRAQELHSDAAKALHRRAYIVTLMAEVNPVFKFCHHPHFALGVHGPYSQCVATSPSMAPEESFFACAADIVQRQDTWVDMLKRVRDIDAKLKLLDEQILRLRPTVKIISPERIKHALSLPSCSAAQTRPRCFLRNWPRFYGGRAPTWRPPTNVSAHG